MSIDGQPWATMDADDYPLSAGFARDPRYREASYSHLWYTNAGLTSGTHTATLRVTTSYGSVATLERRFVVTDGVTFGPLTADGSILSDGRVFTAGTTHRLRFEVSGTVPGSRLANYEADFDHGAIVDSWSCIRPDWWNCPGDAVAEGDLTLPTTPGTYPLEYSARESQQATTERHLVNVVVQAASRLSVATSTSRIRTGDRVTVTGRFVRVDTGTGKAAVPIRLQSRKAGTSTWVTVASSETGRGGWISRRLAPQRTGDYRYIASGEWGVIAAARSRAVTVRVVR